MLATRRRDAGPSSNMPASELELDRRRQRRNDLASAEQLGAVAQALYRVADWAEKHEDAELQIIALEEARRVLRVAARREARSRRG